MKKIFVFVLSILIVFGMTACGETGTSAEETTTTGAKNISETEKAEETSKASAVVETEVSFEALQVVDNDECVIIITGVKPDALWGYALTAELENKSQEKTYMFAVENASINGVMCEPAFATEVAPGKKANEEISFVTSTLESNGIEMFTDIELTFRVYDTDDWSADPVARETVHVYPYGEAQVESFVRQSQSTDNVLVDNDSVTVTVTGYREDEIWGYTVDLFLQNKTDTTVMFSVENASVNGYMADPFYASSVSPGKVAFSSVSWSDSTLEENNISSVEEIEFTIKAYDYDNFTGDNFAEETVTLNP